MYFKKTIIKKERFNMTHITIEHSNTDVRKLWNLAKNNVLSYTAVHNTLDDTDGNTIVFKSKHTYKIFKQFEFSASAMY